MRDKHTSTSAQETAAAVLGWLATEPDMLGRFLDLSGLRADQLRQAVDDSGFLAGMLDFLMSHEPTLMAFCAATDIKPEAVVSAWQALSGPGLDSGEC